MAAMLPLAVTVSLDAIQGPIWFNFQTAYR